jgi:hypothetical protein
MRNGFLLSATFATRDGEMGCASRIIDVPTADAALARMQRILARAGCSKVDITNYGREPNG